MCRRKKTAVEPEKGSLSVLPAPLHVSDLFDIEEGIVIRRVQDHAFRSCLLMRYHFFTIIVTKTKNSGKHELTGAYVS